MKRGGRWQRLPIAAEDISGAMLWAYQSVRDTADPKGWYWTVEPSPDRADIDGAAAQGLKAFIVWRRYMGAEPW